MQEERKVALLKEVQVRELKERLALLEKENDELQSLQHREKSRAPSAPSKPEKSSQEKNAPRKDYPNLDDLRKQDSLTRKVERELAKLKWTRETGDSSPSATEERDDSSSEEDRKSIKSRKKRAAKKRSEKGMQSGRSAKPTGVVVNPQRWPHSELNTSFVDRTVTYDNLSLDEFVAGYSTILQSSRPDSREFVALLEHLVSLMYLAGRYQWKAVLNFHGAVLLDIERGRARWGDAFAHLEARTLHGYLKVSKGTRDSSSKASGNVYNKLISQ